MKYCKNGDLKIFESHELIFSKQQAWQVLVFFFGGNAKIIPAWIGDIERSYAQALMIRAIEMSAGVTWIRRVFDNMVAPSGTITSLTSVTWKEGVKKKWLDHRLQYKPVIYRSIVTTLYYQHYKIWDNRVREMKMNALDGSEGNEALSDPFYCEFSNKK